MEEITMQQTICSHCSTELSIGTMYCMYCGFPENGTNIEQSKFHAHRILKKSNIEDKVQKVLSARKTLYWMSSIFSVFGLFYYFTSQKISILIVNMILASIFLILAYWSEKRPFATLLSALLLYIMIISVNAILEPTTLFQGILIKFIVVIFLVKGIYSASSNSKN